MAVILMFNEAQQHQHISMLMLKNNYCVFVHRVPLPGMETHIPVLFLNLKRTLVYYY